MATYGTTVAIDPVIMTRAAQSLDAQRQIVESNLNSIKSDAAALKSLWEGESADAYQAVMTKLGENSPKIVSVLMEYVHDLNEIASRFLSDEQRRKAMDEALPSDVFGV